MKKWTSLFAWTPMVRRGLALALCLLNGIFCTYSADVRYMPLEAVPGGLSPTPDLTSITVSNQQMQIDWAGLGGGPYFLERRLRVDSPRWEGLGNATNAHSFTLPATNASSFFRVRSTEPTYGSADACVACHVVEHDDWTQTIHAGAFETLKKIGQDKNPECIKCHTVGSGFAAGFKDEASTPALAGVQCENCHGPAGEHIKNPLNKDARPVVSYSAKLCGGCHNDFHHPTFEDWSSSPHSEVVPDVQNAFLDPNPTNSVARMNACGACHSGAVRLQMLRSTITGIPALPEGHEAAATGITCVVCHNPHEPNLDGGFGLRNPRSSTDFYSYSTAGTFASQYNENIQLCAQCHNMRGATPNDTSRPPHHSPQYNMLIGDIGVAKGYVPEGLAASHTAIEGQCAHCHTHLQSPANPSASNPVMSGHTFKPNLDSCVECHDSESAADFRIKTTQADTKKRIAEVKTLLDQWAQTKAPDPLRTKYGNLAWEYTAAGELSNPNGLTSITGPTAKEQASVSPDIKAARMYLYIVEHDGSFGVHNGRYTRYLLGLAKTNVLTQLNAP